MRVSIALLVVFLLSSARPVSAQWYVGGYLGANRTTPATVEVEDRGQDLELTIHDVRFTAEPFKSPQYYGVRLGRLFGPSRRLTVEFEFIHLKVISDVSRTYRMTGRDGALAIDEVARMDTFVQRYSMTHGLNFLLVNVGGRRTLGDGRLTLAARAGAGPTMPHAESQVLGRTRDLYEYAGIGMHAAAGVEVALGRGVAATTEYKFTWAKPEISLADGTGRTSAQSHHVAFGLAFGLGR